MLQVFIIYERGNKNSARNDVGVFIYKFALRTFL